MKQFTYIIFVITLCSITFTSCGKDDDQFINTPVSISFNPAVKINSRTLITSAQYPQDIPFGVWAYTYKGKMNDEDFLVRAKSAMRNSKVQYQGEKWLPEETTYWPKETSMVFFAYSPFSDQSLFSNEQGIQFKDVNLLKNKTTYLFTYPISDYERELCGGLIPVPFVRALSRVEFRMRSAVINEGMSLRLKSMKVQNAAYRGDFNSLPTPQWTLRPETTDVEICLKEIPVEKAITQVGVADFMPQKLNSKIAVILDIYDSHGNLIEKDKSLSTDMQTIWYPGEYITYTLNLSTHKVTLTIDIEE